MTEDFMSVDLTPYLYGGAAGSRPSLGLSRTDGVQLFYPGKEHSLVSADGTSSTWFLAACIAEELIRGRTVAHLDFAPSDFYVMVERLRSLGVSKEVIVDNLSYFVPDRPASVHDVETVRACRPSLVVVDGMAAAMWVNDFDPQKEDGIHLFRQWLVKPFTRHGIAVLTHDLAGSVSDYRLNSLDGSAILTELVEPNHFVGAWGPDSWRANIYVFKDRPGHLRQHESASLGPIGSGQINVGVMEVLESPGFQLKWWTHQALRDDLARRGS